MKEEEGIIKYKQEFIETQAPSRDYIRELLTYRVLCFERTWIGSLPDGTGYGNISCRAPKDLEDVQFFISGSQTGHIPILNTHQISVVNEYSITENRLLCSGLIQASSESLTHAGIYEADPEISAIVHIHNKKLWEFAQVNGVITTHSSIPYGTVEMSLALIDAVKSGAKTHTGIIAMGGHEDGIIAWGLGFPQAIQKIRDLEAKMRKLS